MAAVHVLLLEPILMFVSLYVMIISFEKQRTDFMLAMVLVQGVFPWTRTAQTSTAVENDVHKQMFLSPPIGKNHL